MGGALVGQTSSGFYDAFVRKHYANGTEAWTRQFGTGANDWAYAVAFDGAYVYVAGATGGALPGQTSAGSYDAFVRKYDANGNEVWTRQFGSSMEDRAQAVAADGTGAWVGGYTLGALPGSAFAGADDAFVRKYDANGVEAWTREFGTSALDGTTSIALDSGFSYAVGFTDGGLPGQTSSGLTDAFVRKYDANGVEVWTRQFGTSSFDSSKWAAVASSALYVAGFTDLALPGQTSAGGRDAFVRKYYGNGTEAWTRQFGSSTDDVAIE